MFKQFKIITLARTCFGSRRNHHQGAVLCLAKTTKYGFLCSSGVGAPTLDEHRKPYFVVLAKHRTVPWWWFLREPKHVL